RAAGPSLYRSRTGGAGHSLLAASGPASGPALGACGSHRPLQQGTRAAPKPSGYPGARPTRAGRAGRPGPGADGAPRLGGTGGRRCVRARPRAGPTGRGEPRPLSGPVGPVAVLPRAGTVPDGAGAGRAMPQFGPTRARLGAPPVGPPGAGG